MKLHTFLALALVGCSMPARDAAIVTTNHVREVAQAEHYAIEFYCIPRYREATQQWQIDNADKVCLPAESAYYSVRVAWRVMVGVLESSRQGKATLEEVESASRELGQAFAELTAALSKMR